MRKKSIFIKYTLAACLLLTLFTALGCKKEDTDKKYTNKYNNENTTTTSKSGSQQIPTAPTTTLPAPSFDLPTLTADNITIEAGQTIDYIGNISVEGADDTDVSQISVDTSTVRPQVPGLYKATYTVTYRGYPVTKTIVVTVTSPTNADTPTFAVTPAGESVGTMNITLSSGVECAIPCTTEHFITESDTIDTYSTVSGATYRTSVLRVTFSDGEIMDLETVYTRAVENK